MNDKVTLTLTQDEIRNMLLPLYEFYIFEYIRHDEDIDNIKWLHGQMRLYSRLLAAAGLEDDDIKKLQEEHDNLSVLPGMSDVPSGKTGNVSDVTAEAAPQSDQYKKGFEDAKRAFLVEYARESESMRKRNAQLEVMLNA